ncbi:Large cysteine-rich periplasmic protein omcB precursor [Rubripirellula tenax]|uniref:Large cysteine-rich periplasmic protein omcB n=1 Tax=Rubripirellula tenax TaxID=2528015 RepID=A0A5C6FCP7_9BACT|nr:SpaA isopeptide-forming pilin-related protein [Rubripirellula tenax]TWU58492.1 Large cysteine-rich periplasmic protein omcB precursor [Rubripirellula tenax]
MKRRMRLLRESLVRQIWANSTPPSARFRPRFEALEDRRLLVAATDLADITGRVFADFSGNGFDAGEQVVGASLTVYRDDGDSVFEPGAGDVEVQSATTDANGNYTFTRLTAGNYFVLQPAQTVSGRSLSRSVSPLITVTAEDVKGRITTNIDSFDQTVQVARDETAGDGPVIAIAVTPTAEAIGGERELIVEKTSVNGAVQLSIDDPLLPNQLSFDSVATGQGPRRIVWDGPDNDAAVIDDTGLGGINLTTNAAGVQFQIRADLAGGTATIRVYSSDGADGTANRFSTTTLPIPATSGGFLSAEFIPFSQFTAGGSGGGADFASVGAIELEINGAADVNGAAEVIGAVGTIIKTAPDFANFEQADLSLTKTVDDASPNLNQEVVYTITVTNAGPSTATGVVVTDMLPTGVTFVRSSTATGGYDQTNGLWTIGSVAMGTPVTLAITGRVTTVGPKTNTAQVTASNVFDPDSTPNNNIDAEDDQASIAVSAETIDLSLTKTISNAAPNVGETVVFTVEVFNDGPSVATGVSIRDVLPAGLTLVTATPTRGNYNTTTGIWTIPTIADNERLTLALSAVVNQTGTITNTAEVTAADQSDIDSSPNNSVASEDDQASVTLTTPIADLRLTKTVDNARPNVGDEIAFTVIVNNVGPDAATGVVVTDLLPLGFTSISSIVNAGTYDDATGRWTIGNVAIADTPTLTIRARVNSSAATTNTAQITAADQFDPNSTPNNNVATEDDQASVTVDPPSIDLSLTKTIDVQRPNVGDEVVYTVTLTNSGDDQATGVVVRDVLPAGVTLIAATESAGIYTPANGNWSVATLDRNASATLSLRVRVDSAAATNTAEVIVANEFDSDSTPGNNVPAEDDQATVGFSLASSDLSLTKTVNNASPNIGEDVTFTVVVSNAGPDTATGVQVRDVLPAGTTFVSSNPSVGSYDQTTGLWAVPSIALGTSATLTITATATTNTVTTNTAEIIATDQSDPDSTPGNGAAGEDDIASTSIQGQQVDLSLTKTISNPRPNVGDEVTFVITVTNAGPNEATGVNVTDRLPAGLTLLRATPSQGSFNTTNRVWTVGTVSTTESPSIELVARVDQVVTDAINVAEITAAVQPDVDSTPGNDVATEDDQASVTFSTPVADLSLVKSVSNDSPNVGDVITFQVLVTNDGPQAASGVQVTDLLPAGLQFNSTTLSEGTYDATTGIWDIGSIPIGGTVTLGINATVTTQGAKTNTARITAAGQFDPDSTPGNNVETEDDQDSVTVTPPVVDLSLEKTVSESRPRLGDAVTFTITTRNAGPSDATGVVVTDVLPDGFTFVDSTPSTGNYNATTGRWNVGDLASGTSATLQLIATVNRFDTLTNIAEITSTGQFDSDSTPGNGDVSEDDYAAVSVTPASADLSLTKTTDNVTPNVGDDVTFTLTIANAGPDTTTGVTVRDVLPAGLNFVSSSPSVGTYNAATGIWSIDSLASGATSRLEIRATVDAQTDRTNTAEIITSNQFDPDSTPGNGVVGEDDQASVSLTPQLVDLALMKVIDDATPNVGDSIAYTLTLSNAGPSAATGVAVTDRLPDGLTFADFVASQGSYNSASGVWNVGSVATGVTPTLTINATVGNTRGVTNTAEITASDQVDRDSTPGNGVAGEDDQATATFTTQVADLSLTKSVNNPSPTQDEVISFTLTLANAGPNIATNVSVKDLLPTGLTFVSANPSVGAYDSVTGFWAIPNVPSASAVTIQIDARATSPMPSTNVAEVMAVRQFDPDSTPGNAVAGEDDIASVQVSPVVIDLNVRATVDNEEPVEGDEIELSFFTDNSGNTAATGVVTSVVIPAGLTIVSATPSVGTYDAATGRWEIGTLGLGQTASLVVRAVVDTRGFKTIPVQVIEADQFDLDSTPGNNVPGEDDQTDLEIRGPRLLSKRLFLAR